MDITASDKLVEELRAHSILPPAQMQELASRTDRPAEARKLLKDLVKRQWLTRYQASMIDQGRTAELILGPYVLLDRLGEGGMGEVFRARHVRLERVVALKIIRTDRLKAKDAVGRFEREAKAAAQLHHPNIVTLFDEGSAGDVLYLAMEFIKGVDLARWVRQKGPMPVANACNFVRQAALGLQHANERGMVHRDIKPSNLMLVAGANQVKLLDMGLARLDNDSQTTDDGQPITVEGAVMGTPDFLAPEQAKNAHGVDIRADVYSLGCTLFFLVTGSAPFAGGSLLEKLLKHQTESPRPLAELRPDTPPGLQQVLDKMMAKKPEDRFQTPALLASALAPFCRAGAAPLTITPRLGAAADTHTNPGSPTLSGDESVDVELVATSPKVPAKATAGMHRQGPKPFTKAWMAQWGWVLGTLGGIGAVGAAVILVVVFVKLLGGNAPHSADEPPPPIPKASATLDALTADSLGADEVFPWQPRELVAVLGTHKWRHWGPVRGIAFNPRSPTGHEIASYGDDDTIRLCIAATGRERWAVQAQAPRPIPFQRTITFSNDGRFVVAITDNKISIYEAATGREEPINLFGTAAAFLPDGSLVVGGNDRLDVYSLPEWKQTRQIQMSGSSAVIALTVATKANLFAALTRSAENPKLKKNAAVELRVFQLGTWQPKTSFAIPLNQQSRSVQFTADGSTLITATAGAAPGGTWPVVLWDVEQKKERARLEGNLNPIVAMALSRDNQTLLTGASDGSARVFSLRELREKASFSDHEGEVSTVAITPDDSTFATGGRDGSIRLYDLARLAELEESKKAHQSWIKAAIITQKRTTIAMATLDNAIHLLDAGSLAEKGILVAHRKPVLALALSADNRILASASMDKTIGVWDLDKQEELPPPILGFTAPILAVAFAPEGRMLAAGSITPAIKVLDVGIRKEQANPLGQAAPVVTLEFFRDAKQFVSGSDDGSVRVWDLGKGKVVLSIPAHPRVAAVAVSPKGKHFASAGSDGFIQIWDTALEKSFWARRRQVSASLFLLSRSTPFGVSPQLYVGPPDRPRVNAWRNGLPAGTGGAPYRALAYSPDGKVLAAGCSRGVALFEAPSGRLVQQWEWHGGVRGVQFDAAGKHLLTVNDNGTAYVLRLSSR
jgi:serine/threonine protein kinase/WD40 repeat protein